MLFKQTFLHIGCGHSRKDNTPFADLGWNELRLDIDKNKQPDFLGSMTNMKMIPNGSVHAVYSSHNIEHLYPHEIPKAFSEFKRVLNPQGFALITCPDIKQICRMVLEDKLYEPAYLSVSGPITPFEILYGQLSALKQGNLHMAHHCGFTEKTLAQELSSAGFADIAITARQKPPFDIWALATYRNTPRDQLIELTERFFPE